MIYERITDLIGNTPLLKISPDVHGLQNIDLYAKLEMMNPFGSVKDRIAWVMIQDDIDEIKEKGQTIFENSSGNTAKALQAIAGTYGVKTKLVTALAKVQTVKDIVMMMGAEIEEIMGGSECFDPNDPGTLKYLRNIDSKLTERKTAVFIVCDRLEWYVEYIRQRRPQMLGQTMKAGSLRAFETTATASNSKFAITVAEAESWIIKHDPLIIDVRGNLAYKMATLPGAINIPLELFETMIDAADPFPKERPVLLVCPVGEKTARYAEYLQSRGYQAFSLAGGVLGWRNAGKPLLSRPRPIDTRHHAQSRS